MDIAASIVGLLLAGAKVYNTLDLFLSKCVDAPSLATEIFGEVRDFRYALRKLRSYVERAKQMTPLGASSTDVAHLAVTLAACTMTFSELEKRLGRLALPMGKERSMTALNRLRWTMASSSISEIVRRLQQHKATLTLLLMIWRSESTAETEVMHDALNDRLLHLTMPASQPPGPVNLLLSPPDELGFPSDQASALAQVLPPASPETSLVPTDPSSRPVGGMDLVVEPSVPGATTTTRTFLSFKSVLFKARPYRNQGLSQGSIFSVSPSQRQTRWSTFSGRSDTSVFALPFIDYQLSENSLAEESELTGIEVPVHPYSLYNSDLYEDPLSAFLDISRIRDTMAFKVRCYRNPNQHSMETYRELLDFALINNDASTVELLLDLYKPSTHSHAPSYYALPPPRETSPRIEVILAALVQEIRKRNTAMVILLLKREVGLERIPSQLSKPSRNYWYDLLEYPVVTRDKEMIQVLLDAGAVPDKDIVQLGVESKDIGVLDLLAPRWREGDPSNTVSGEMIVLFGSEEMLTELLRNNTSVNRNEPLAPAMLHLAVREGNITAVNLLRYLVGPMDSAFDEAVVLAIKLGRSAVLDILVPDWRAGGMLGTRSLDETIAVFGCKEMITGLLEHGSLVNSESPRGLGLLRCAVREENIDLIFSLLCRGVHPDVALGEPVLLRVVKAGAVECLRMLAPHWKEGGMLGQTSLDQLIMRFGNEAIVNELVEYGVSDSAAASRGLALINSAVQGGNVHAVKLLRSRVDHWDAAFQEAIVLAAKLRNRPILDILVPV